MSPAGLLLTTLPLILLLGVLTLYAEAPQTGLIAVLSCLAALLLALLLWESGA